MVRRSTNCQGLHLVFPGNATHVSAQSLFYFLRNGLAAIFGAENIVYTTTDVGMRHHVYPLISAVPTGLVVGRLGIQFPAINHWSNIISPYGTGIFVTSSLVPLPFIWQHVLLRSNTIFDFHICEILCLTTSPTRDISIPRDTSG